MNLQAVENILSHIGMSKNEIKIYLALLNIGSSKVGRISKEARTDRSATYDSLKRLLEKGFVSYAIIAKRKWFQATNPERIVHYLKEQQQDVESIVPELKGAYEQTKINEGITLYKGYKGVKNVFQDILEEGKDNCMFGSESQFEDRMPYLLPHFVKGLESKGIHVKSIVRDGRGSSSSKTTEIRNVDVSIRSNVVTNIYGNKVAIIIWSDIPEAIIINNKLAAESYRNYFNILWENAKRPGKTNKT